MSRRLIDCVRRGTYPLADRAGGGGLEGGHSSDINAVFCGVCQRRTRRA
jgi:hypothetical protein